MSNMIRRSTERLVQQLASGMGASMVGSPKGALQGQLDILYQGSANVRDPAYAGGADNTGLADSTAAINAALAAKSGFIHFPDGKYKMLGLATHTGQVNIAGGNVVIRADAECFRFTDAAHSRVSGGIRLENITVPYTIQRNYDTWAKNAAADVTQSNDGYQPTPLDKDFYGDLPAAIKNQRIGPKIVFTCSSEIGQDDVKITGLSGRFLNIVLEGYSNSTVEGCSFQAGMDYAGVVFYNNTNLARLTGTPMGYAFAKGTGNKAISNNIQRATGCGITYFGNIYFIASGNWVIGCAESGIKTYQDDTIFEDSIISRQGTVQGNFCIKNRYDGIDASATYPTSGTASGHVLVSGNFTVGNRCTGIFSDAQSNQYIGNHMLDNGLGGATIQGANSVVIGNFLENNLKNPGTEGVFNSYDLEVSGDNCDVKDNSIRRTTAPVHGYAMYHSGTGGCNVDNSCLHPVYVAAGILLNVVPSQSRTTRVPNSFAQSLISDEPTGIETVQKIWRRVSEGRIVSFFQGLGETPVGQITVSQTSTLYGSPSDYRLKYDIKPLENATEMVMQYRPRRFRWKANGKEVEGFVAGEFAEVQPDAVSGEVDQEDEKGNPIFQSLDDSRAMAPVVGCLQEQVLLLRKLREEFEVYKAQHP